MMMITEIYSLHESNVVSLEESSQFHTVKDDKYLDVSDFKEKDHAIERLLKWGALFPVDAFCVI